MRLSSLIALCCLLFVCHAADAETVHRLFRKVAVFPIADAHMSTSEDAWWQMREALTKDQRFLVASRRFMINRGVFQPRKALKPADIVILAKLLDAEALVTMALENRQLRLTVYNGETGGTFWDSTLQLHPALPVADQLIRASQKMVFDFIASLPYQGYQIVDENVGRAIVEVDGQKRATVFLGLNSSVEVGDPVQWIEVKGDGSAAYFNGPTAIEVIAEGKVFSVLGNQATVEITKARSFDDLKQYALIRFPNEVSRMKKQVGGEERTAQISSEYLSSEMKDPNEIEAGHHPTATALAYIGNFALLILLAF